MARKLNLNIPKNIAEFEALMNKILMKKMDYKLILRGKGLEFEGYREFNQNDDSSLIDWKASLRTNNLLIKKYSEEREIKIMFVIDIGDNMVFGSTEKLKCEYSAEMAIALANIIINSGDHVGFTLFNKSIIKMIPPGPGKKYFNILSNEISNADFYGGESDITNVFKAITKILPSSSIIILISDFIKITEQDENEFHKLSRIYETIALIVKDPLDKTLPNLNKEVIIENPRTGEKLVINPKIIQKIYERNALEQSLITKKIFEDSNIDYLELSTENPFSYPLANFLKKRTEKRGY